MKQKLGNVWEATFRERLKTRRDGRFLDFLLEGKSNWKTFDRRHAFERVYVRRGAIAYFLAI